MQKSVGKPGVLILCKATYDWLIIKMNKNSSNFEEKMAVFNFLIVSKK